MTEPSQAATSRSTVSATSTSVPRTSCSTPPATWAATTRCVSCIEARLPRMSTQAAMRSNHALAQDHARLP